MDYQKKTLLYNLGALLCAVWFMATGWIWVYFMNLIFSFPLAILGYFLWRTAKVREPENTLNKYIVWIFFAGIVLSLAGLFLYK